MGVLGLGAAMEADAGTSGDLDEDGQRAVELGGVCHGYAIDQGGDEVVGVLQCRADGGQILSVCSGRARVAVFDGVEGASHSLRIVIRSRGRRFLSDQFIIHRSNF